MKKKGKALIDPQMQKIFADSRLLYDKTPRYVYSLDVIIQKVNKPFIATFKSPLEGYASAKKRGEPFELFRIKFEKAVKQLVKVKSLYPSKLLIVRYESLANNMDETMEKVADFIGISPSIKLNLDAYNASFGKHLNFSTMNTFHNDEVSYQSVSLEDFGNEGLTLAQFQMDLSDDLDFIQKIASKFLIFSVLHLDRKMLNVHSLHV